ncbi:DUF3565 domain-containing protein [Acinetobacter equi]|uniref:Acetyltransferase n=1 Tax=Acinetobacter equi TaxID=1324350 RepID=A0A0N9VCC0_9GAMM|nr:DUF3565 domain-containing protein [Acinetobacter equi]ALH94889.1 acetyltransferase [Acinetobacter equi]
MRRKIINFSLDQENDWIAHLDCDHSQHVRHDPPWQNRPWVMTEIGRRGKLGSELNCKICDISKQ